ncbi:hypothetical protein ACQP1U_09925 [Actinomycetota bacterium]
MTAERIADEERAERRRRIEEARHSSELEGTRSDDAARAIQDDWAEGRITTDEMIERTLRPTAPGPAAAGPSTAAT